MKTFLYKLAFVTLLLIGFVIPGNSQIDITACGWYEIVDPSYSGATYTVYAWIEVIDEDFFPCTNPGNPFIEDANEGQHYSRDLVFDDVEPPAPPEPLYSYRVVLVAVRNNPAAESKPGVSSWAGPYGLCDWSPSPITLEFE